MDSIIRFFTSGGPVMYVILFALILGLVIIIERIIYIRFKNRIDTDSFVNRIIELVKAGPNKQSN